MWYETFLVFLDLVSLASCFNGVCINFRWCNSIVCYFYGGIIWYGLSGLGSLAGILDIVMNRWSADVTRPRKNIYLQFHYFLAWVAIIIGYPLFVTATWLTYCPSFTVHLHLLCIVLPLLVWSQKATAMVAVTEMCLLICLVSHFYISVLAGNAWCLLGAMVMASNIFFLCFSNHYALFGIHSKEAYIITSALAYYILSRSVQTMVRFTSSSRSMCRK